MARITPQLLIAALLSVVSMSLVPLLIRSAQVNEVTIGIVRLLIALAVMSPLLLHRGVLSGIAGRNWLNLAVVGLVFGSHWLTYFISIKTANASVAAISISTYGIHLLLLNWIFKRQKIYPVEWGAVALCFLGCVLIAPSLDLDNKITLGVLIGVFSGFLYACLPLLHQRITEVPTLARAWGQFAFAGLVFFPLFPLSDWQFPAVDWWRLLALGVICTIIGHSLWVKVSTELPPVLTSVTYYLYVPIAVVGSYIFLNEPLTLSKMLGGTLIVGSNIGIALLAWRRHNRALTGQ